MPDFYADCYKPNKGSVADIKKVERILVCNDVWFEVDSIHKYPCYGVYLGDKFINCDVRDGQYVLLWSDENGYFSAVFDTINEVIEYCGDNDWIGGAVVDGEIISIKGGNHEN